MTIIFLNIVKKEKKKLNAKFAIVLFHMEIDLGINNLKNIKKLLIIKIHLIPIIILIRT